MTVHKGDCADPFDGSDPCGKPSAEQTLARHGTEEGSCRPRPAHDRSSRGGPFRYVYIFSGRSHRCFGNEFHIDESGLHERGRMTHENILQIDVEEWFQDVAMPRWKSFQSRVVEQVERVLTILKDHRQTATFFVLGYVADRFPELVMKIKEEGHEVASHGYTHTPLTRLTPHDFEEELSRSIEILKNLTGQDVWGFRAPQFTLVEETAWVVDMLKNHGFRYDSSVFPVKTRLYGVPDAPRNPYRISSSDIKRDDPTSNLLEFPPSVYRVPGIGTNVPVAGGFYLRLLPYSLIARALQKINASGLPAVCYLHPWELDSAQPKSADLRWYHYYGLRAAEAKFRKLLRDFRFISTQEWMERRQHG